MFKWFKSMFTVPEPSGPDVVIRFFEPDQPTIVKDQVSVQDEAIVVDANGPRTFALYEVADPEVESCFLTFRAQVSSELAEGRAYLEMWCRLPGKGEFFSKGFDQAVTGHTNFGTYECQFYLKYGQKPDLIKLNLVVEGQGVVRLKDIELRSTPLAS